MGIMPSRVLDGEIGVGPPVEIDEIRTKPERDILLITGDGAGLFDDLEAFLNLDPPPFDTMCINYSATVCPWKFQHFVAGDSHMPDMQAVAKQVNGAVKHCWNPNSTGFDIRWLRNMQSGWNGTTGNLAIQIGIALDYIKIVLAGCPMDESGNWYSASLKNNDVKKDKHHESHLWKWTEISLRPKAHFIRSMSGNTANLFGIPDRDWLLNIRREAQEKEITNATD